MDHVMSMEKIIAWLMSWIVTITQCHNEVRDTLSDLAALGHRKVIHEHVECERNEVSPALTADLGSYK